MKKKMRPAQRTVSSLVSIDINDANSVCTAVMLRVQGEKYEIMLSLLKRVSTKRTDELI